MSNDKTAPYIEVLVGSLFPAQHAQALWPAIQEHAPRLSRWLIRSQGQWYAHDALKHRCAAHEHYLLQHIGFKPLPQQPLGAGMALILALRAGFGQINKEKKHVWIAELIHLAPGREGANLLPARLLEIHSQESQDLLYSLQDYIQDTPFDFTPLTPTHWLVHSFEPLPLHKATVELAFNSTVQDWWDTSDQGRAWRQWVNEIQMIWFQHPVNHQRHAQGAPVLNSLWLMGGAHTQQLTHPIRHWPHINYSLEQSYREQDWGAWLQQLAQLDQQWHEQFPDQIVFTGESGFLVCESATPRSWLHRFFTKHKTGHLCWLNPN